MKMLYVGSYGYHHNLSKLLLDFSPIFELYLPQPISTKLSFFLDTLYNVACYVCIVLLSTFWLKNILFPKLIFPLPTSSLGFFSLIWQHQRTLKYAICNELLSSEKHRCYDDDLRRYMKMLMMSR